MTRWLAALLRLYPRSFRRRHGDGLERLYRERYGLRGVRGALHALADTLRDAPCAHLDSWRRRRSSLDDTSERSAAPTREWLELVPSALELRQAVRSLARRPTFSLVIVATLALAIGANTAIFSLVRGVLLAPLPYQEPERLVRLVGTRAGEVSTGGTLAYLDIADMAERSRTFSGIAVYDEWTTNLTGDGEPERLDAALVSAGYFDLLGVEPAAGRFFLPEEDIDGQDRVVVLEHGFWQRRYGGDPDVLGRAVLLDERPHVIVGVAGADFEDPDLSDEGTAPPLWRPLGMIGLEADRLPNRGSSSYVAIGRLAPSVALAAAQAELGAIALDLEREHPESNAERGVALVTVHEQLVGDVDESLLLLLGAVGFLLAIAVANVGSMMLGRGAERADESALRRALGAGRLALVRYGLLEGSLLALAGCLAGVGLAHWLLRAIVATAGSSLPRAQRVAVDAQVLLFALLLAVLVSLACGLVPAWRELGGPRIDVATSGVRSTSGAGVLRLRGALVTVQFGLALVLLHGAVLLGQSLLRLQHIDVGVETSGLVTLDLAPPYARYSEAEQIEPFYAQVFERLRSLPGVASVSSTNILPLSGGFDGNSVNVPGRPTPDPDGAWSAQVRSVSASFFDAAGIPILRGRPILDSDRRGARAVAVVNQAAADSFWPDGEAVGATVTMNDQEVEIVGVAGDTKHLSLVESPYRYVYLAREQGVMSWQAQRQTVLVRLDDDVSDDRRATLFRGIRQAVWQVDPQVPVANLRSMEQLIERAVRHPRLRASLVAAFAAVALLLGAVGIYGVASYGVALERRALAVRMALGADRVDIARHVLGRVTAWALTGSAVGLAAAWVLGRLVERFLYGVEAVSADALALVALLVAVAWLAAWAPARRAVTIDPARTLHGV